MKYLLMALGFWSATAFAGGIERLQQFSRTTQSLRADFVQTVMPRAGRTPKQSSGRMALSKPGKFRWQIEKPYPQLMVGDGKTVWMYDPDLKQATRRRMDQTFGSTPAAFLAGGQSLDKTFTVRELGPEDGVQAGLEWVEAVPRNSDGGFARMRLGFVGDELRMLEMLDNFGQTTRLNFLHIERNPAIAAEQFRFVPPAGVDVLGD